MTSKTTNYLNNLPLPFWFFISSMKTAKVRDIVPIEHLQPFQLLRNILPLMATKLNKPSLFYISSIEIFENIMSSLANENRNNHLSNIGQANHQNLIPIHCFMSFMSSDFWSTIFEKSKKTKFKPNHKREKITSKKKSSKCGSVEWNPHEVKCSVIIALSCHDISHFDKNEK